jgi:hypothetical protein
LVNTHQVFILLFLNLLLHGCSATCNYHWQCNVEITLFFHVVLQVVCRTGVSYEIWGLFNVTIYLGNRMIVITLFAHSGEIIYWQTEEKYRLYENTLEERVNTCDGILKQVSLQIVLLVYAEKKMYRCIHLCPFSFNLLKCICTGWWYIELIWRTAVFALECCHED